MCDRITKASPVGGAQVNSARENGRQWEINAEKREMEPVIVCIYKTAAVCNSTDRLSCESSEMA